MIFATVGSHPTFKFDRLLSALGALPGERLVVQHGPGAPPPHAREAVAFMSFEQMLDRIGRAAVVVSHAGVGSILCSLEAGRVPVVMPREARFDETVDDHQLELAEALAPSGRIVLVESGADLAAAVGEAEARQSAPLPEATEMLDAVRAELGRA